MSAMVVLFYIITSWKVLAHVARLRPRRAVVDGRDLGLRDSQTLEGSDRRKGAKLWIGQLVTIRSK